MIEKRLFRVLIVLATSTLLLMPAIAEPLPDSVQELVGKGPTSVEPTAEELSLYNLLMAHRAENGKPPIPLSQSLTYVAQLHVRDLAANKVSPPYTLHSWSKNGPWEGVRYTANHRHARLMWNKPKELTSYKGDGFEVTFSRKGGASAKSAFKSWVDQRSVNDIILNSGNWETIQWHAIGIGVFGDFAVIWFGDQEDVQ